VTNMRIRLPLAAPHHLPTEVPEENSRLRRRRPLEWKRKMRGAKIRRATCGGEFQAVAAGRWR
jgi:hypothetical protein